MTKNENDNYISIDEAAEYLGIKTVTIRNWIKKEMVPAHKVGKLWKFKRSELDEWVKSGKSAINYEVKTTWTTIACQIFMLLLTPNIM